MDDADARAILREHGEEPPVRGKLNDDWRAKATHYADQDSAGDDYDGGTGPGDFDMTEAAEPPALPAERRPRRVKTARPRFSLTGKPKPARPRGPKPKRVSLVNLITDMWAGMGSVAARINPPLGTCLMIEAPVAGLALEDVFKGTVVDTALQPVARYQDKARIVTALIVPPVCVMALEHAQTLPERERQLREAMIEPILDASLVTLARVMGDRAGDMAERAEAEGPARENAAKLKAAIWSMRPPAQPEPAAEPEPAGV
jgi:hypothetical protein